MHWARRLAYVRGFALYRSATDPRTQIPAQGLLPFQPKRARPYLYSDTEVRNLLSAALKIRYCYESGKLRPWVYYCLFGLLSVTGLRVSEAQNLEVQDVDLKAAVLTFRCAKFGKNRLVPLHSSTCKILANYIDRRRRHWGQRPVSSYLFITSHGHRLDGADIRNTSMPCHVRPACVVPPIVMGRVFTTSGIDSRLVHLCTGTNPTKTPSANCLSYSAFLGHVHVADTQWYLNGAPELMREAMRRLERRWEDRP